MSRPSLHFQPVSNPEFLPFKRGGTFTDCVGNPGSGKLEDDVLIKLLSVDPQNYDDAPLEGIRRLMEKFTGKKIKRGEPLDTSEIGE